MGNSQNKSNGSQPGVEAIHRDNHAIIVAKFGGADQLRNAAIMHKDKGINCDLDRLPILTRIMFLKPRASTHTLERKTPNKS